jgi:U4/U6 small nuclear ribonucleoprotein SNU13
MAEDTSAAWPIADEALSQSLLDLVQQAAHYRQLKKVRSSWPLSAP